MQEIDAHNWEEFESRINDLRQSQASSGQHLAPLLFRGQQDSCWSLCTTLERRKKEGMLYKDYYRLISVIRPKIEVVTGTQWLMPTYGDVEKLVQDYDPFSMALTFGPRPAYEYMAYLRHHGFPSPLLDWKRSPHVAAYFAFREANDNRSVSIYVLSEANLKSHSNGVACIHRFGSHIKTHRRHYLQQSDYTMCLVFGADNEWRFAKHDGVLGPSEVQQSVPWGFELLKFNIPSAERLKVLRRLDEHNLTAFSLFGSEESLMETMALRRLSFST